MSETVTLKSTPAEIYERTYRAQTEISIWAILTIVSLMTFIVMAIITFSGSIAAPPIVIISFVMSTIGAIACLLQAVKAMTVFNSLLALQLMKAMTG